MNNQTHQFEFDNSYEERLDRFLAEKLPEVTRSRVQQLIKSGNVKVNQEVVKKTGSKLNNGDQIGIEIPAAQPVDLVPESIALNIVYEDKNVVVVNKEAGMVVHPSAGHQSGTLVHAIMAHSPDIEGIGGEIRPGIVHRLDKDTSGLIILAKNERALNWLQQQFKSRNVYKAYFALVDGAPPTPKGIIDVAIGRDSSNRKKMAVVPSGKGREAKSEYHTIQSFENHTLLKVILHTGRTHQIRLHLAYLNCPIVGDTVYGRRKLSLPIKRQFLHAAELKISLTKDAEPIQFFADLPDDLNSVLNNLNSLRR